MQDVWAQRDKRWRWSVAFPIVESFAVRDRRKAREVLGDEAYRRLYHRPSAMLRLLGDEDRARIADLEVEPRTAANAWIAIDDEIVMAERSEIGEETLRLIGEDLAAALEGMSEERRVGVRLRAAWKAEEFIRERRKAGKLTCDDCGFDPSRVLDPAVVRPRSLLDVHHRHPLAEGVRYTSAADFALLCPTCHRVEHQRLRYNLARPSPS
jgi:5-methylcytosine-specific restriction protein A